MTAAAATAPSGTKESFGSPRYACAVVVEHGGGGSAVAAPIARDILIECQRRDPSRRNPNAEGGRREMP